jgi:branched-chain amino acid transport system ATP-binding protein
MTTPILELSQIRAGYGSIEVLHHIDLVVPAGQVVALLGPNGAGKSTTIKVASAQVRPTSGALRVAGRDVTGANPGALARAGVCTIPEGRGIFANLTVRENLWIGTYGGVTLGEIEEKTYARFPRLCERRTQLAGTLSGGEQQMLALARGLATDPVVLLLDELSMGLAPLVVSRLYEEVAAIAASGVSVLVVEQFARTVLGIADQVVVLVHGAVRRAGPAGDVDEATLAEAYLGGSTPGET